MRRSRTTSWRTPFRALEDQRDGISEPQPVARLGVHVDTPLARQPIKLCLAPGVAHLPFGGKQLAVLEAMQGRIERALCDLDHVAGNLLEALSDGVPMQRDGGQDLQDQEVERTLRQVGLGRHHDTSGFDIYSQYVSKIKA